MHSCQCNPEESWRNPTAPLPHCKQRAPIIQSSSFKLASEGRSKDAVNLNINRATVMLDLLILQEHNGPFPCEICTFSPYL
jgi:hypothetical protein